MFQKIARFFKLFTLNSDTAPPQTPTSDSQYSRLVESAFALLEKGKYESGLELYEIAFAYSKHSILSLLRAALCAYKCQYDAKSKFLIQTAIAIDWESCEEVLNESGIYVEFNPFIGTLFEQTIRTAIEREAMVRGLNFTLRRQLAAIRHRDQKYFWMADLLYDKLPKDTSEHLRFKQKWIEYDNLITGIIDKYGYPGLSMVGESEAFVACQVIQSLPLKKQEKYLSLITEAAENGELPKKYWAFLVDRIRMRQGKTQLYGSQMVRDEANGVFRFHDIEDDTSVNKLRAEIELRPLEEYADYMGFKWTPPNKD